MEVVKIKPNNKTRQISLIYKDFIQNKYVYLMALPVLAYYILFKYVPMYGAIISFKDFSPMKGILGSDWVGFAHFKSFFESYYFTRVLTNTILINVYGLVFGFPAPIILALLLNELRSQSFKRLTQTITYIPHFISIMVICGMLIEFTTMDGVINDVLSIFGVEKSNLLVRPELFRTIFIGSGIWQEVGWGSIIYLSALTSINPELYESAKMDGASRWRQVWNITLPGIMPTIVILLILRMGNMMSVGFEKIILLYNPNTYETADVISSFVYRKGLIESNYSYSTAVGLFNSVIEFTLLVLSNKISKKVNDSSLW